jgi:hypothetical protein
MRTINTTRGPVEASPTPGRHVNTTAVVEENLVYTDEEPEISFVLPAGDWCALVDGDPRPLVAFVVLDDASAYGVAVGDDGRIDLNDCNVEDLDGFTKYEKVTNEREEPNA